MVHEASLVVLGPSGVGKSSLQSVFQTDLEIEPHRVRRRPRRYRDETDQDDVYYLSQTAYDGLRSILSDQEPLAGPTDDSIRLEVYNRVLFFKVRGKQQVLFLPTRDDAAKRRIEIYGPVLAKLLQLPITEFLFQPETFILLLNPWRQPLSDIDPNAASRPGSAEVGVLVKLLKERGEAPDEIQDRVSCIREELSAWKSIASVPRPSFHVLEAIGWPHAEYTWPPPGPEREDYEQQVKGTLKALAEAELADPRLQGLFLSFFT